MMTTTTWPTLLDRRCARRREKIKKGLDKCHRKSVLSEAEGSIFARLASEVFLSSLDWVFREYGRLVLRSFYVEALSAAEDHFSYRFSLAVGGSGAIRRDQSAHCSRADFGSSDHGRSHPRRPAPLGRSRQSPSGAARIHLRLNPGDRFGTSGGMVSRRRRCCRSASRRHLPDPKVGALSTLHSLVRSGRNVEGHDHHDWRPLSRPDQHRHRSESHRSGAAQGRARSWGEPTPDLHESGDSGRLAQYFYWPQVRSRHCLDSGFYHRDRSHQGGARVLALGILSVAFGEAGVQLHDRLRDSRNPWHLDASVARACDVPVAAVLKGFTFLVSGLNWNKVIK